MSILHLQCVDICIVYYIYLLYSMCLSLAFCHLDAKAFKALPGMSAEVDQAVAAPVGIPALDHHNGKYHYWY